MKNWLLKKLGEVADFTNGGAWTPDEYSQVQNLLLKNANLRQTRDLLLPKLISGELDLENLDINNGNIAA